MSLQAAHSLSTSLVSVVETVGRAVVRVDGGRRRAVSGLAVGPNEVLTVAHGVYSETPTVFTGESRTEATIVGRHAGVDLVLLRTKDTLPHQVSLDEPELKVGQVVLMLGRPGETVRATSGILSAVGQKPFRAERGGEVSRYVEADAVHQPGFSGGPLVDISGAVLGLASTALIRGKSLTIPVATLRSAIDALRAHGSPRRSWLGLDLRPVRLPQSVAESTGDEVGLLVVDVAKGGPAEQAGIGFGDTVLHVGDDSVKTLEDFYGWLRVDRVGQTVPARVFRQGKVETLQLTLGARP
jgi:S1-C subfamily serine protease